MVRIDSVMLHQNTLSTGWQALHRKGDRGVRADNVVIMVVPNHDGDAAVVSRCEHVDVRILADPFGKHRVERYRAAARSLNAIPSHEPGHSVEVENWFVHAVGRKSPETIEIRLPLELERPRHHPFDANVILGA